MDRQLEYTPEELAAIRAEYAKDASDTQFTNFMRECTDRKLVPGKHIYFQLRTVKEYDAKLRATEWIKRAVHLTSIDAFRLIAQRTGAYRGQKKPVWIYLDDHGNPSIESHIPLPLPGKPDEPRVPWAAVVSVLREGFEEPMAIPARFEACAVYYKNKQEQWVLNDMWKRRGPEQLAKCSEAQNLRAAFPEELGKLYIAEELDGNFSEIGNADTETEFPVTSASALLAAGLAQEDAALQKMLAPAPAATPSVDHEPAEGKNEPRPDEEKATLKKLKDRMRNYSREILPHKHAFKEPEVVLKKFIYVETGVDDPRTLTIPQFEQVLGKLDEAAVRGKLTELLTFQKENRKEHK